MTFFARAGKCPARGASGLALCLIAAAEAGSPFINDDSAIDPRELDGRTRIDEGEHMPPTRSDSDHIVTRHSRVDDEAAEVARRLHESSERNVRYPAGFERRSDERR